MKILIIGEHSPYINEAFLRMVCEKIGIPVICVDDFIKENKGNNIFESIDNLLMKVSKIPILEIPIFFQEPEKSREKLFPDAPFRLLNGVRQLKIVRIRSPCKTGIYL